MGIFSKLFGSDIPTPEEKREVFRADMRAWNRERANEWKRAVAGDAKCPDCGASLLGDESCLGCQVNGKPQKGH